MFALNDASGYSTENILNHHSIECGIDLDSAFFFCSHRQPKPGSGKELTMMHRQTLNAISRRTNVNRIESWAKRLRNEIERQNKEFWPNHTEQDLSDEPLVHLDRHLAMSIIYEMYDVVSEVRRLQKGSEIRRLQKP